MNESAPLTATSIMAAASERLLFSGYKQIADSVASRTAGIARAFEDEYGVVQVVVYETWGELESHWSDAQAVLVDLMSKFLNSTEPKAWDGYLVLFTPGPLPQNASQEAVEIRNDTNRVRKLLATGEDLRTTNDVQRLLLPLLPILSERSDIDGRRDALSALASILASRGIDESATETLTSAFLEHRSLMESLHRISNGQ